MLAALAGVNLLIVIVILVLVLGGLWKIFTKAGKPGWAAIIPIYNYIVLTEIIGKPIWWAIMMLIPCVNIVFMFLVYIELAKCFGKDTLYGILLVVLSPIMIPVLGFSDAQYTPPSQQSI
ncbi:MAG: signal peptidase I [Ignavibacteria bacterium]|nr:signal peptidase I [Ignavibacteria bacterium]